MKQKFLIEIESDKMVQDDDILNVLEHPGFNKKFKPDIIKIYKINDSTPDGLKEKVNLHILKEVYHDPDFQAELTKEINLDIIKDLKNENAKQTKTEQLANKLHEKLWNENKFSK